MYDKSDIVINTIQLESERSNIFWLVERYKNLNQ